MFCMESVREVCFTWNIGFNPDSYQRQVHKLEPRRISSYRYS
jgi:hypothetical protein